jgi:hypothetical protein
VQRQPSFDMSQEFPLSSLKRSLPMPVQFGHFSVHEIREQLFNRARRFSWLFGSWAAQTAIQHWLFTLPTSLRNTSRSGFLAGRSFIAQTRCQRFAIRVN